MIVDNIVYYNTLGSVLSPYVRINGNFATKVLTNQSVEVFKDLNNNITS